MGSGFCGNNQLSPVTFFLIIVTTTGDYTGVVRVNQKYNRNYNTDLRQFTLFVLIFSTNQYYNSYFIDNISNND